MMNNANGSYQNQYYGGMQPGVAPVQGAFGAAPVKSWLPDEVVDHLRNDATQFSLSCSEEDMYRAQCNHRFKDGSLSLIPNDDGTCTCSVCGYKFSITNQLTQEQVEAACTLVENILQTTKLLYMSLDPKVGRDYFQIIAFLRKVPKVFEIASNDFKKYENVYGFTQGVQQNAFAIFGSMNMPYGGMMGGMAPQYTGQAAPMGYGQQMPYGQMPYAQPGYAAAPQPMYGQAPAANMNPFYNNNMQQGYGQVPYGATPPAQQGYAPQQNMNQGGFAMNPTGAATPNPASQVTPQANVPAVQTDAQAETGVKYEP